jgi:hypothetical protein
MKIVASSIPLISVTLQFHRKVCVSLVAILGFATPLVAQAAGAPEGAYLRSEFTGGQLRNDIYVFQGGQVAYPASGDLEKYDFAAHKKRAPTYVGKYSVSGSSMRIDWPDGNKWEGALKPDKAGGFDYRSAGYAPIKPLVRGGASVSFDYEFRADGTYSSTSAGSVSSKSARSTASAGRSASSQGRYSINGSTLTLTPTGAAVLTHKIYYVPTKAGDKKPDMIIIDGVVAVKG